MAIAVITAPVTSLLTTLTRVKAELGLTATTSDTVLFDMLVRASSAITRECGRTSFGVATYQEVLPGSGSQLLGVLNVPLLAVSQVVQGTALGQDGEVIDPTDPDQGYALEDTEAGVLYRPCGWGQTLALQMWGWQATSSRYILPGGTSALRYTVTYTAGYFLPGQQQDAFYDMATGVDAFDDPTSNVVLDTALPPTVPTLPPVLNRPAALLDAPALPGALEQACLVTVKTWWFERQRDVTVVSQKSEEQSVTYDMRASSNTALPAAALGYLRNYRRIA